MFIFYILILFVALVGIRPRLTEEEKNTYLSKNSTNAIKGIFIMTVFLRHGNQYVSKSGYDYTTLMDKLFVVTDSMLGQLIVVMFLFFSGYGVMVAIQKKGETYVKNIPKHRVFNTLINFDIAVTFFFIVALLVGRSFTWTQVLLSFVGWEGLGNSNWYIFVILACYLSTWLSFLCVLNTKVEYQNRGGVIVNTFIIFIVVTLLYRAGKQQWWYNTILCYPLGMYYALHKSKIERYVRKKYVYSLFLVCSIVLFFLSFIPLNMIDVQATFWGGYIVRVFSMIFFILLLMMKFKIENAFIIWMGANLFPLYIYQRLPMILISTFLTCNPYFLFLTSFVITCAIVPIYKKNQIKI